MKTQLATDSANTLLSIAADVAGTYSEHNVVSGGLARPSVLFVCRLEGQDRA
jgi:hypothetical protein